MKHYLISYAQNREDIILNAFFQNKENGFYVDVGANHPVIDSVTKLFYDKGWHGINLEPANTLHAMLTAERPRDLNLKIGVSNQESVLNFREYPLGDGLSTFSNEMQLSYEKNKYYFTKEYVDHQVPVTTLAKILAEHAPKTIIDFMKIDIEGYEYEAIEGNDWLVYRPSVVCIESNHVIKDWHPILEKAGYEKVFWDGLNEYFVATEHREIIKNFSYVDSVLLGPATISWKEKKLQLELDRQKRIMKYELNKAHTAIQGAPEVHIPSRFRGFLKQTAKSVAHNFEAYATSQHLCEKISVHLENMTQNERVQRVRDAALKLVQKDAGVGRMAVLRAHTSVKKNVKAIVRRVSK